jgi:predicted dienelactone hydrolase
MYRYDVKDLYSQRENNRIYGKIYIPQDGKDKKPTVIFSHGFGSSCSSGAGYSDALASQGYRIDNNSKKYDFRRRL